MDNIQHVLWPQYNLTLCFISSKQTGHLRLKEILLSRFVGAGIFLFGENNRIEILIRPNAPDNDNQRKDNSYNHSRDISSNNHIDTTK